MLAAAPPPSSRYSSVYPHAAQATVAYFWFWMLRNRVIPDPVVLNSPTLYSVFSHFAHEYDENVCWATWNLLKTCCQPQIIPWIHLEPPQNTPYPVIITWFCVWYGTNTASGHLLKESWPWLLYAIILQAKVGCKSATRFSSGSRIWPEWAQQAWECLLYPDPRTIVLTVVNKTLRKMNGGT